MILIEFPNDWKVIFNSSFTTPCTHGFKASEKKCDRDEQKKKYENISSSTPFICNSTINTHTIVRIVFAHWNREWIYFEDFNIFYIWSRCNFCSSSSPFWWWLFDSLACIHVAVVIVVLWAPSVLFTPIEIVEQNVFLGKWQCFCL